MGWDVYNDMQSACDQIRGSRQKDPGYSTPDVYGRAVQFFLALEQAAKVKDFATEEVNLWRGFLTMLALRNLLDLPLVWKHRKITSGDALGNALSFPPKENDQLLYPGNPAYQWDGQNFFVLAWEPKGHQPKELAIYSPMTLVYPVADWRNVFKEIPELDKFFNSAESTFRHHMDAVQGGEMNFVHPWLKDMHTQLMEDKTPSSARAVISSHLLQFMQELEDRDSKLAAAKLPLTPRQYPCYTAHLSNLVPTLVEAYDIGGPVFSEQMCLLKVKEGEGSPFECCEYPANYEISGTLESGVKLYAFLPIHAGRRSECCGNGLAQNMSLSIRNVVVGGENKQYIHASTSMRSLPDIKLERDFILREEDTGEVNTAVFYRNLNNEDVVLTRDSWPLISVWPPTLDANWKQYYIMRYDSEGNCLRVSGEPGLSAEAEKSDGTDKVQMGYNSRVIKTSYVPDAIPIVRLRRNAEGKLTENGTEVGMVTPVRGTPVDGTGSAIVAVDFGTSSTRVFYRLVGDSEDAKEIVVAKEEPLEVTTYTYKDESKMKRICSGKLEIMSESFVAPIEPEDDETLFSIFRRSVGGNMTHISPLLDGIIYQPAGKVEPDSTQDLITDLKWNGNTSHPYYIAFMQQLCLHVMTHLYQKHQIRKIEWRYALPRVMAASDRQAMALTWKSDVLSFLSQVSGDTISHTVTEPPTPGGTQPSLPVLSESIAASRYFDKHWGRQVNPLKGYIVVDIGGGSTDVALWQRPIGRPAPIALKWHSSVRVAGRNLLTKWIEKYINTMSDGIRDNLMDTINTGNFSRHPDPTAKRALVDRLLTIHSQALLANYQANIAMQTNGWGVNLRNKITQGVALLMFSLGYQMGTLMKAGRYKVPAGPGSFTICFGGRGSNILNWSSCGPVEQREFFQRGIAAAGANWPRLSLTTITSNNPKCEVSLGLLADAMAGAPTGWEDVGDRELMEDSYFFADEPEQEYYEYDEPDSADGAVREEDAEPRKVTIPAKKGAATKFYEAFESEFPSGYPMKNLSDDSSQAMLAAVASRISQAPFVDDAFQILMESIYANLEDN